MSGPTRQPPMGPQRPLAMTATAAALGASTKTQARPPDTLWRTHHSGPVLGVAAVVPGHGAASRVPRLVSRLNRRSLAHRSHDRPDHGAHDLEVDRVRGDADGFARGRGFRAEARWSRAPCARSASRPRRRRFSRRRRPCPAAARRRTSGNWSRDTSSYFVSMTQSRRGVATRWWILPIRAILLTEWATAQPRVVRACLMACGTRSAGRRRA